ncbi:unnamed protein product [Arctogadus glacialis]
MQMMHSWPDAASLPSARGDVPDGKPRLMVQTGCVVCAADVGPDLKRRPMGRRLSVTLGVSGTESGGVGARDYSSAH